MGDTNPADASTQTTPEMNLLTPEQAKALGQKVKEMLNGSEVAVMLAVGQTLFVELFGGRVEAVKSKSKNKTQSVRMVAEAMGKSASFISRAVGLHLMAQAHGGLMRWPSLSATHFYLVLGLAAEQQTRLLDQAQAEGWSSSRLEEAIIGAQASKAMRGPDAEALFEAHRALRDLTRMLSASDGLMADLTTCGVSTELVAALGSALLQAEGHLNEVHDALSSRGNEQPHS